MSRRARLFGLMTLAMLAFTANPLLCRMALKQTAIDPASFTLIRLWSGAATLCLLLAAREGKRELKVRPAGAVTLFAYAATFSYAYITLDAGVGTLLLFGAVQGTMISTGIARGERLTGRELIGLGVAAIGLVTLLAPGATAPSLQGATLMITAGIAWGVYSILGLRGGSPVARTAGNFLWASILAVALAAIAFGVGWTSWDARGAAYAALSGAIASGLGYAVWYAALPSLLATHAAIVQLSVPAITAVGGVLLLDEHLTPRLLVSAAAILGGLWMVLSRPRGTDAGRAGNRTGPGL